MATSESNLRGDVAPGPVFATTHWSVVLTAARSDTTRARAALEHLCQAYWFPLYAYVRRRGHSPPDAQDLTQEFFARLLAGNWLATADQQRGRFRTFLLAVLQHFITNEWHKAHAQKRGGHHAILSLNDDSAERRYELEPVQNATPESLFERGWALALLNDVLARLEAEYGREGKAAWMEAMRPVLTADGNAIRYGEIAARLEITETAARVAAHRLRQRYRRMIRAAVADTVDSPDEVEGEMRHLFEVLSVR
ncbi:MAG: sigma factor [Verrucomicrobiota bacterium]|jgi:RNA polymerase sigma-70 factor (ECF subfamily)